MKQNTLLLEHLKQGSHKAFDALYEQYFDMLYGFVFSLTRSHEQAKELAQDVFVKVWIHREQIDTAQSFKAWLYHIAQNRLTDQIRKRLNDPLFEDYLSFCINESLLVKPEVNSFDFESFSLSLERAKETLSPRQRVVFELCKEQGFTSGEVASQLHISEQAVYNYLSQSLNILRKELKPFYFLLLLFFIRS